MKSKKIFLVIFTLILLINVLIQFPVYANYNQQPEYNSLSLGSLHSTAITENGDLYAWGNNSLGEVGNNSESNQLTPVMILSNVISVKSKNSFNAALTENGDLYMWGDNINGQLGIENITQQLKPFKILSNVKSFDISSCHSAAILENGDLYAWGDNSNGEIGNNSTNIQKTPTKILESVSSVELGVNHSAAILENGDLYVWGKNNKGQIGNNSTKDQFSPKKILDSVISVKLGLEHSAAITTDGSLYVWGSNEYGQIGNNLEKNQIHPAKILENIQFINLDSNTTSAIDKNGNLFVWGMSYAAEGVIEYDSIPKKILSNVKYAEVSQSSAGAILENGDLYIWKANNYGQIGNGNRDYQVNPVKVLENVVDFSLSLLHSAAITTDGSLYTWGFNPYGQLGILDVRQISTPTKVNINKILIQQYNTETDNSNKRPSAFSFSSDKLGFLNTPTDFLTDEEIIVRKHVTEVTNNEFVQYAKKLMKKDVYPNYHISDAAFENLISGIKSNTVKETLREARNEIWNGSCFGMASVEAIHFASPKRLSLKEIDSDTKEQSLYEYTSKNHPNTSAKVEDLINYYQLGYYYPINYNNEFIFARDTKNNYQNSLNNLISSINDDNIPVIVCITNETSQGAHAVILLEVLSSNNKYYEVKVADPNYFEPTTMYIYKTPDKNKNWIQISYNGSINANEAESTYTYIYNYIDSLEHIDAKNYITNEWYSKEVNQKCQELYYDLIITEITSGSLFVNIKNEELIQLETLDNVYGPYPVFLGEMFNEEYLIQPKKRYLIDTTSSDIYNNFNIIPENNAYEFRMLSNGITICVSGTNESNIDINTSEKSISVNSISNSCGNYSVELIVDESGNNKPVFAIDVQEATTLEIDYKNNDIIVQCDNLANAYISIKDDVIASGAEVFSTSDTIRVKVNDNNILISDHDKNNPFSDVSTADYFYDAVLWAVNNKITSGYTNELFSPNSTCTRAEVLTFLWRANGRPDSTITENPFKDVYEKDYYYKAVLWGVENKITSGYTKDTFAPSKTVTRGEVVTFLWRSLNRPSYIINNVFTDILLNDYYYNAVLWAAENKITAGYSENCFAPMIGCTRGQIVSFLYRARNINSEIEGTETWICNDKITAPENYNGGLVKLVLEQTVKGELQTTTILENEKINFPYTLNIIGADNVSEGKIYMYELENGTFKRRCSWTVTFYVQ